MLDKKELAHIEQEIRKIWNTKDQQAIEDILYYAEMDADVLWKSIYFSFNYNQVLKLIRKKLHAVEFLKVIYERRLWQGYFLYRLSGAEEEAERILGKIHNLDNEIQKIKQEILSLRTYIKQELQRNRQMVREYAKKIQRIDEMSEEELERELDELQRDI